MSRILSLILILTLTSSCDKTKIIYVASTLTDCKNDLSKKCLQVKENKEDEWTILNDDIEGFEHKDGFLQKIQVKISKIKNPSADTSVFNYKFVKLIYEEEEKIEKDMDVSLSQVLDKNHAGKWQVNNMIGIDSLSKQPTMIFKDGNISGNAGCNNYGASFTIIGNEMTFSLGMATKMYCTNMSIEKTYFDCLSKVKTYKLLNDKLSFYDEKNTELMTCVLVNKE